MISTRIASTSIMPDPSLVAEGDIVVIIKYKGKTYAEAYKLNKENVGLRIKSGIEYTQKYLKIEYES